MRIDRIFPDRRDQIAPVRIDHFEALALVRLVGISVAQPDENIVVVLPFADVENVVVEAEADECAVRLVVEIGRMKVEIFVAKLGVGIPALAKAVTADESKAGSVVVEQFLNEWRQVDAQRKAEVFGHKRLFDNGFALDGVGGQRLRLRAGADLCRQRTQSGQKHQTKKYISEHFPCFRCI